MQKYENELKRKRARTIAKRHGGFSSDFWQNRKSAIRHKVEMREMRGKRMAKIKKKKQEELSIYNAKSRLKAHFEGK